MPRHHEHGCPPGGMLRLPCWGWFRQLWVTVGQLGWVRLILCSGACLLSACLPTTYEDDLTSTAAPTPLPSPISLTAVPPTSLPPATLTAQPTSTFRPPVTLPAEWEAFSRPELGLTLAAPLGWVDIASLSNTAILSERLGQPDLVLLANSLETGIQVLTARPLQAGQAFWLSFGVSDGSRLPPLLASETLSSPTATLGGLAERLGEGISVNALPIAGRSGAFIDVARDPTGVLFPESTELRFRLGLMVEPASGRPVYMLMGGLATEWEELDPIFLALLERAEQLQPATAVQSERQIIPPSANQGGGGVVIDTLLDGETDEWGFNARAGQYATITLQPEGEQSDFTLRLYAPSGRTLAEQDRGYAGDSEVIADVLLEQSGLYTLEVGEFFNESDGYTLSVVLSEEPVYSGGGSIAFGEEIRGSLREGGQDVWFFDGQAGQTVSLILSPAGELDVRFSLYLPDGRKVATYDEGYSSDSEVMVGYELPITGAYRVVIGSFGDIAGEYTLSLDEGNEEVANFYDAGELAYGDIKREVLREDEVHAWFIQGLAGEALMLTVTPLSADLDLDVWLLDPEARRLVMEDSSLAGESEEIEYALPRDGEYIVVVREFFGEAGDYQISLTVGGDTYLISAGIINYGNALSGELQPGRGMTWTFVGTEGDVIRLMLTPESAEQNVILSLRDPAGNPVTQLDQEGAGLPETLSAFELTSSGAWTIVVQEAFDAGGRYALSLERR